MNRAFGKPAARLGANVPFLSTDYSLQILAHLRGGGKECRHLEVSYRCRAHVLFCVADHMYFEILETWVPIPAKLFTYCVFTLVT